LIKSSRAGSYRPRIVGSGRWEPALLTELELDAVRRSAPRGQPLGDEGWVEWIARRLHLKSTMRQRGRPRVRFTAPNQNKEA
jgi:hypothetical protein